MDVKLLAQAVGKFLLGAVSVALMLFVPAGTLDYCNGWLLMGVLFVPMFFAGIVMLRKSPDLLRSRLKAKETESQQRYVIRLSGLMFVLTFVIAGLDYRFGWLPLPRWLPFAAAAVFLLAYLLYAEVLRENAYLSRTVEVQEGQKVIDTGLYGVVRHPMYAVTLVLFLAMPLVLGSLLALIPMLGYPAVLVKRIRNEEQVLSRELEGYADYQRRVTTRLIPFIW